jgi:hypothetical protein
MPSIVPYSRLIYLRNGTQTARYAGDTPASHGGDVNRRRLLLAPGLRKRRSNVTPDQSRFRADLCACRPRGQSSRSRMPTAVAHAGGRVSMDL